MAWHHDLVGMAMRDLRRAAWEREGGRCFVTGRYLGDVDTGPWELHHRMPGGMGGSRRDRDTLPNVLALLGTVHNLGGGGARSVHGTPAWSMPRGWLLSPQSRRSPAQKPALHWHLGWVFLLPGGGYERVSEGQATSSPGRPPLAGDAITPGATRR